MIWEGFLGEIGGGRSEGGGTGGESWVQRGLAIRAQSKSTVLRVVFCLRFISIYKRGAISFRGFGFK